MPVFYLNAFKVSGKWTIINLQCLNFCFLFFYFKIAFLFLLMWQKPSKRPKDIKFTIKVFFLHSCILCHKSGNGKKKSKTIVEQKMSNWTISSIKRFLMLKLLIVFQLTLIRMSLSLKTSHQNSELVNFKFVRNQIKLFQ